MKDMFGSKTQQMGLFDILDTAQNGGAPDGAVGQGDVNQFLSNWKRSV